MKGIVCSKQSDLFLQCVHTTVPSQVNPSQIHNVQIIVFPHCLLCTNNTIHQAASLAS